MKGEWIMFNKVKTWTRDHVAEIIGALGAFLEGFGATMMIIMVISRAMGYKMMWSRSE